MRACILRSSPHMKNILVLVLGLLLLAPAAYGASGKVKLLFFYRKSCKWCGMMDSVIDDPSIKNILQGNVSLEKINIYGTRKLAGEGLTGTELKRKYAVFGIPTLIFIGAGGRELLRIPGVLTKEDFRDLVCHHAGIKSAFCGK